MNISTITAILSAHKGQNISATFRRPLKTRKGVDGKFEKVTEIVVRGGIDYEAMKSTVEGRASGDLPEESAGLPWGEWVQFPIHIAHKGADYVRLYPAAGINFKSKVTILRDGVEVTKDEVKPLCLASEFQERDEPARCFTLKAESIEKLGK